MSSTAHVGSLVRDANGYPTAPKPIANAAIAGRLKNGDGARVRFRRKCSTPWSIAKTANTNPPMKEATDTMERALMIGGELSEITEALNESIRIRDTS